MIAVFGASGNTGRFVVAQLLHRGFAPVAIGRDNAKMVASGFQEGIVQSRIASIDDPPSLDRSLAGAVAVINCAGPFLDTADAVAAAALRTRIHYFDVTAEQMSALATFDRFGDATKQIGVVVMPAMGSMVVLLTCWPQPLWATGIPLTRSVSALRWIAGIRRRARG